MSLTLTATFEEGTDGATVTTASGAAVVTGTPTYSTTNPMHGTTCMVCDSTSDIPDFPAGTTGRASVYCRVDAKTTTTGLIIGLMAASSYMARVRIGGTTTNLSIADSASAQKAISSAAVATSSYFRLDFTWTQTGTSLDLQIDYFASPEGTTPTETLHPAAFTAASNITRFRTTTGTASWTMRFDTLRLYSSPADTITPFGASVHTGAATGTLRWAGTSATGSATHSGHPTGGVAWAGTSAAATATHSGHPTGGVGWAGAATATATHSAHPTGAVAWAGTSVTSTTSHSGHPTGVITWAGTSATASAAHSGASTGGTAWSSTAATATAGHAGHADAGTITWSGHATGTDVHTAQPAAGSVTWTGHGNAQATHSGQAAAGSLAWTGVAAGDAHKQAAAAGAVTWTATVTAAQQHTATADGAITWTGQAAGPLPPDPGGTYLVPPDPYRYVVAAENHRYTVPPARDRQTVPAESSRYLVPAEPHTEAVR